ncbi:hypothetical protein [Streptomyces sp. NPDC048606]|uniref:hypothetical protein n=1 Tax=Streptomyces sp. NPDC048606 TaxID=3154726 RepID=UPI00342A84E6
MRSSSTRRTSRSTLRTATVLAGAAAVLALPVGAAFADSPTGPEQPEVLPGVERPAVDPSVEPKVEPSVEPSVLPAVDPSTRPTDPAVKPPVEGRAYVTTVKLADGSIAKVYRIGGGHFEADVLAGGTKLDTLVSKGGKPAYGQHNGLHVVLHPNGTVTSWIEGAKPKPKPEPKPDPKPDREVRKERSVRIAVPDGCVAKLIDGPKGERVEIRTSNGHLLGTIDLKHPSVMKDGWTYKLVQDGKRVKFVVIDGKGGGDSWVYDFATGRLIETYKVERGRGGKPVPAAVTGAPERVVPKGAVKAGAEGVHTPRAEAPVLLAAGGGMAAVGAAGLGFAMLRRR